MIPWEKLDEVPVPGGRGTMTLVRRGEEYVIRIDRQDLMGSKRTGSERELATLAIAKLAEPNPRVLIGGLGLGFTLAAALECTGDESQIEVAELVPAVWEWNKGVLAHLAGHPLDDERAEVRLGDVCDFIRKPQNGYDAILLDVDNGPDGMTKSSNSWLYEKAGLIAIRKALRPGGRARRVGLLRGPEVHQTSKRRRLRRRGRADSRPEQAGTPPHHLAREYVNNLSRRLAMSAPLRDRRSATDNVRRAG